MWRIPTNTSKRMVMWFHIAMIAAILVRGGLVYGHNSSAREAHTAFPHLQFAFLAAAPLCAWGIYAFWRIIRDSLDAQVSLRRGLNAGWLLRLDKKQRSLAAFERLIRGSAPGRVNRRTSEKMSMAREKRMNTMSALIEQVEWPPLHTDQTPWNIGLQGLLENVIACREYAHFIRYVRQVLDRLGALHAEGKLAPVELSAPLTGGQPGERAYAVVGGLTVFGIDVKFLRRDWGMTMGVHLYTDLDAAQVVERLRNAVPRLHFEADGDARLRGHVAQLPILESADEEVYPPYYAVMVLEGEPEAPTHFACYPWSDAPMR
jgi:hypothetical protein